MNLKNCCKTEFKGGSATMTTESIRTSQRSGWSGKSRTVLKTTEKSNNVSNAPIYKAVRSKNTTSRKRTRTRTGQTTTYTLSGKTKRPQ